VVINKIKQKYSKLTQKQQTRIMYVGYLFAIFLLGVSSIVFLNRNGIIQPYWRTVSISEIQHEIGYAFIAQTGHSELSSHRHPSNAHILEDGKVLWHANAYHDTIRYVGQGHYSFWHNIVYFSASDGSDPRSNGRRYEIEYPMMVGNIAAYALFALTITVWMICAIVFDFCLLKERVQILNFPLASRFYWLPILLASLSILFFALTRIFPQFFYLYEFSWISAIGLSTLVVWMYRKKLDALFPRQHIIPISIGFTVFAFVFVLKIPIPESITGAVRKGTAGLFVLISILSFLVYTKQGWWGSVGSLALTVILFAMPLSWLWQSGFSDGNLIGGLFPFSDATGYWWGAERLLNGANLTQWLMRRPLFTIYLASIHGLTQGNLQATLAILCLITALAVYLAAREIQQTEGPLVAVTVMGILFLYYRLHIGGKILTESLGLTFGALAMGLLWRGTRTYHLKDFWVGMLALTLALMARAGAFFVLPALTVWGVWYFRGQNRISFRFLGIAISAILVGVGLNYLLPKIVGDASGMAFSNFSTVLYGLVSGNKGWTQIYADYPGVIIPDQEIYRLAWEILRENPKGLVFGILGAYKDYFNPKAMGAFSFLRINHNAIIFYVLSGLGTLWCIRRRRNATFSLVLAVLAGILLSIPFAPPIDADTMRAYAATIPFTALMPGLGLTYLLNIKKQMIDKKVLEDIFSTKVLVPLCIGILLFLVLGSIGIRLLSSPKIILSHQPCPPGSDSITMQISRGSYINFVENSVNESYIPNLRISDFRQLLGGLDGYPELVDELIGISAGQSLYSGLNLDDYDNLGDYNYPVYLVTDTLPDRSIPDIFHFCATQTENKTMQAYRFYYYLANEDE
jgi:hypothetical protein